jgi:hypothetical protein
VVPPPRTPLRADRLRALNVPRPAVVERDLAGRPRAVDGRPIEAFGESWRVDDEWWRRPIARHYLEVFLTGGGRVMLFQDLETGEWFEQTP